MKICFLTNTLNIASGWGRYSWEIIRRMNERKSIETIILTEDFSDNLLEKPILKKSLKNLFFIFLNALKARKYVKQCDVIHCLDAYPYGLIGALANIGLNKKLIINGVGTYSVAPLEQGIRGWLLKWAYYKADCVPCISFFTEKEILKRIELKNTQVIYMGIDFNRFQAINFLKKKNTKSKVIISVGILKKRKGYHISIPALAEVKKKYPDFRYYIVGNQDDDIYFKELKNLVVNLNLEDNIVFLGEVSDEELIKIYYQSDLFLLTPVNVNLNFEGFGLVYLEANACGKPVIGTYGCGAEDAIKNNFNGLLVSQNDIKNTSEAILKILDNPVLAQKLGNNGRILAQKMDWLNTVEQYIKIYDSKI